MCGVIANMERKIVLVVWWQTRTDDSRGC